MSADTKIDLSHFTRWLAHGERGLSSEAIVTHLTGEQVGRYSRGRADHPSDPADFRRCQLLIEGSPLVRLLFPSMRSASPVWARLVDAWDEIHETILSEAPDYLRGGWGSAPKGCALMRRVIVGGVECSTCSGTGNAAPCAACKGSGRRAGGRCRAKGCHQGHHFCAACRGKGYAGGDY